MRTALRPEILLEQDQLQVMRETAYSNNQLSELPADFSDRMEAIEKDLSRGRMEGLERRLSELIQESMPLPE